VDVVDVRKISKATLVGGIAAAALAATVGAASPAQAFPGLGYCPGGGAGYGGWGGYCDGPSYPDGSYDHTVMVLGGCTSGRVCPPDPANPAIPLPWMAGQQCAFRK
jgi:hypothetical protein